MLLSREPEIRRASLGQARDAQLLHLVGERRPFEAQPGGRSTSASDNPNCFRGALAQSALARLALTHCRRKPS
jgi:hypothetical protein